MSALKEKIPELRATLQRIHDAPEGLMEAEFKKSFLDGLSDPKCWMDGIIPVAWYGWQQFQEGWNRRAQPAEEVQPVAWDVRYQNDTRWLLCRNKPDLDELAKEAGDSAKDAVCRPLIYGDTRPPAADAEMVRKAARYDFLRDHPQKHNNGASAIHFTFAVARPAPNEWCIDTKRGEDMDAAIDAALAASKEKEE